MPQALYKLPKFHLISCCENFVNNVRCAFSHNFHTKELGKILVFGTVEMLQQIQSGLGITDPDFLTAFILFHSVKMNRLK